MANVTRLARPDRWIDWSAPETQILIGLMAPTIMTGMTHHTLAVALPTIRSEFALGADMAAWVVMVYSLPFMALMPLYGRLGDGLGKRRLLILGTFLFMAGTVLVMAAPTLTWLMVGRFIQGAGTAGFVPLCIAIISQRFGPKDRGRMMGTWNSAIPLTGLIVPYFGGLLVDLWGWRAIYPPILVAGVLTVLIIRRNIQPLTGRVNLQLLRSFDWVGVVLMSGALATLLFYTSSRPITGMPALQDLRLLGVCVLLFGGVIVWEPRQSEPYVHLSIFANMTFTLASVLAGLRMFLMSTISFLMALYLTDVHGYSASVIGIVLALQAGMLFLISRAGGQLADRWGSRWPVTLSMGGLVAVEIYFALLPETAPLWAIVAAVMAHGLIIGLSLAALHRASMGSVEEAQVGMAAGLYSMIRFAGGILGTAMAGVLLQRGLTLAQAPVDAYQTVFWIFAGVALCGTIAAWFLREPERQ